MPITPLVINKETDTCHGRGFSEADLLGSIIQNFQNWIVRSPVASPVSKSTGGPGWYIIDDQSGLPTDPYIVVANNEAKFFDTTHVDVDPNKIDNPHKVVKLTIPTSTAGIVNIECYLWWDNQTQTGYFNWLNYDIPTLDDADFLYDFRGGPRFFSFGARSTAWRHFILTDWDNLSPYTEDPSVASKITSGVTSGTSVKVYVPDNSIYTTGYPYFIFDANGVENINQAVIESKGNDGADYVVLNELTQNFAADSVLCEYLHRYSAWYSDGLALLIPYCSYKTTDAEYSDNYITHRSGGYYPQASTLFNHTLIRRASPRNNGEYAVSNPVLLENLNARSSPFNKRYIGMDMLYGKMAGIFVSSTNNLVIMETARDIEGYDHIYLGNKYRSWGGSSGNTDIAVLIPDYNNV